MNQSVAINTSNLHNSLTPDVIDYLNSSLSKLGVSILRELYRSPQMQQKNLAASIHTSTTSLSNILSRLENIQPQLLVSERVGRSKYYSLTEIANSYVVQVILPQTNKIHTFSSRSQRDILISETLKAFYQFQDTAGSEWDIILDDLLLSNSDINLSKKMISAEKDELFIIYTDFMNQIKNLKISNSDTSIREVYDILNQPILIKRLEAKLTMDLKYFYILKPLFDLEKQNLRKTTYLVDNIFAELAPDVFLMSDASVSYNGTILPDEQYNKIFREICIMKNDFTNNKCTVDKEKITEYWQEKYFWQGYSLIYIAEKCSTLYRALYNGSR